MTLQESNAAINNEFNISKDFIETNKKFKPNTRRKKGGPHNPQERHKRQNEVYRLFFEYGYSARKISELMSINRNTINGDVHFWYSKVLKNWSDVGPQLLVIKNIERSELQRSRLVEQLHKTKVLQEKISIERLIHEIESKILQTQLKLSSSIENVHRLSTKWLNDWMKKNNQFDRYISYGDVRRVSGKSYDKICSLIKAG